MNDGPLFGEMPSRGYSFLEVIAFCSCHLLKLVMIKQERGWLVGGGSSLGILWINVVVYF